ncbi:hypothetical protein [Motiliproteus sp. SC1-56]|uniref:hypothetical protein n=1 Tax=Motiliproteus sp. SC1-56 TaxID=2799565 RepID=UPI001A8EDE3E|nr:hypothetical protein [Motiliproteus sp. SC1-56]
MNRPRLFSAGRLAALLLIISGLARGEAGHETPTLDWMPEGIDWEKAETVSMLLEDHVFTPEEVVLKVNRPYKLVLTNVSDRATHDLVDLEFFHSVVFKQITIGGVVVNTPHVHSLELKPNSSASLYLVPIKSAEYEIYCSVPGHRDEGMEGYILIEN